MHIDIMYLIIPAIIYAVDGIFKMIDSSNLRKSEALRQERRNREYEKQRYTITKEPDTYEDYEIHQYD